MKKRNPRKILRSNPILAPSPVESGVQWCLHLVLFLWVWPCVLCNELVKIVNFIPAFYAVSDRVADDCKVVIVLCICILFAMWKKTNPSLLFIYIKVCLSTLTPKLLGYSSICILRCTVHYYRDKLLSKFLFKSCLIIVYFSFENFFSFFLSLHFNLKFVANFIHLSKYCSRFTLCFRLVYSVWLERLGSSVYYNYRIEFSVWWTIKLECN